MITIVDLPEDRGAALADRIGTRHGPERVDVAVGDLLRRQRDLWPVPPGGVADHG
jgi:hypothetical protein